MTQSQILYFLAVAREGSISKAAEKLYVSQPAVSKQLAQLEEELGVRLFHRGNNNISITDAGRSFERFFLDAKLRFEELRERVREDAEQWSGEYRLALVEGWDLTSFYPDLYAHLGERYPKVQFQFLGYNLDQMLYSLQRREVDGAFMIGDLLDGYPDLSLRPLTQVDSCIILNAENPLLKKPRLTVGDFSDSTFIIPAEKGTKTAVADYITICNATGFTPKVEYSPTLSAAFMKIQTGQGVLLKTNQMQVKNNPLFRVFPLDHKREVCFGCLRRHETPLTRQIKQDIIRFCENGIMDG